MKEVRKSTKSLSLDTYVFVDASNIRAACLKTLDFKIDFCKLLGYFQKKYPNLKAAYYYEGKSKDDTEKQVEFDSLTAAGYGVRFLEKSLYSITRI